MLTSTVPSNSAPSCEAHALHVCTSSYMIKGPVSAQAGTECSKNTTPTTTTTEQLRISVVVCCCCIPFRLALMLVLIFAPCTLTFAPCTHSGFTHCNRWCFSFHPLAQISELHSGNLHCVVVVFGGGGRFMCTWGVVVVPKGWWWRVNILVLVEENIS